MDNENKVINKTMDFNDLFSAKAKEVIRELNQLIVAMKDRKLKISSWFGGFGIPKEYRRSEKINRGYDYKALKGTVDDENFPWFLYWEIVWLVLNNNFSPNQRILDLGGSSSLFSYYLASQGINVVTIDFQRELVDNANYVSKKMGWNMKNYTMDIRKINLNDQFDHITAVCVYEHIPMYDRIQINKKIKKLLIKGGRFSLTFDYRNPSMLARISSPEDVKAQFVDITDLNVRGNRIFHDNGKNYLLHPFYYKKRQWSYKMKAIKNKQFRFCDFLKTEEKNNYTFGALFLDKKD